MTSGPFAPCTQATLLRRSTVQTDFTVNARTVVCRATGRARIVTTGGSAFCAVGNYSVSVAIVGPNGATSQPVFAQLSGQVGLQPDSTYDVPYFVQWSFEQATNVSATYDLGLSQTLTPYSNGLQACFQSGSYAINQIVGFSCQSVSDQ